MKYLFAVPLLLLGPVLHAEEHHQQAHVHGVSEVQMAIDGDQLELYFTSPAMNLVGFGHLATEDEDLARVEAMKTSLETPKLWLSFQGSSCQLQTVHVDVSELLESHADEDEEEHHQDESDPAHHEEHEHEDEGEHHHGHHADIAASYHFTCKNTDALESASIRLMKQFSGIETLRVLWLTEQAQGAVELTGEQQQVSLR